MGGQGASEKHLLVGSPASIVSLGDRAPEAAPAAELVDWAEEVVMHTEEAVQPLKDGGGGPGAVAVVTDEAADEEAVALRDPGLIILEMRVPAGEAGALAARGRSRV